jgi:hypothetical protein
MKKFSFFFMFSGREERILFFFPSGNLIPLFVRVGVLSRTLCDSQLAMTSSSNEMRCQKG